ncbi:MAG TPA: VWA domain-containing protein [Pyrinomonadaceae bacterium]
MVSRRIFLALLICVVTLTITSVQRAQEPAPRLNPTQQPAPTPQQETEQVKVFTEEVRLPVIAFDDYGHFDPTLEMDDLLVLEDGEPQQIRSIQRIPANVLLLLDTGNEITLAKSVDTTRAIVMRLLASLRTEQRVAIVQFNERVELLQDWTIDREQLAHVLNTKLHSGKRSRLSEGVRMAAEKLKDTPMGSRHVVIITDGVETPGGKVSYAEAVKKLVAAQATVHIISYSQMVRQAIEKRNGGSSLKKGTGVARDAIPGGDPTLPPGMTRNPSYTLGSITFDTDREMKRWYKRYAESAKQSEQRLISLAGETGGQMLVPISKEAMLAHGEEVARDIGAQHVVTYRPKRPLAEARAGEYRRIEIAPRRTGLTLRTRRGYVVTPTR